MSSNVSQIAHLPDPYVVIEAEQQVLGAALISREPAEAVAIIAASGGASIFSDPLHAAVYKTIKRLADDGRMVGVSAVLAALPTDVQENMRDLGGTSYLARMAAAAPPSSTLKDYCDILGTLRVRRDLRDVLANASAQLSRNEDPAADIAASVESACSLIASDGPTGVKPVSAMKATSEALSQIHAAYSGQPMEGITPRLETLRRIVPVFAPGELWLIGGRPSMGKTAVALSFALDAARDGHPVIFASFEMLPSQMANRAISEITSHFNIPVPYKAMRSGSMSERQMAVVRDAARMFAELPLFFLGREYATAELLGVGVKQALRHVQTDKMPLVVVDYVGLMKSNARTRYEQITDISIALKALAMQIKAPVLGLSQLNRDLEKRDDKRPTLADFRESGQLEQDADGVLFPFRPVYYTERAKPDGSDLDKYEAWEEQVDRERTILEIAVAKQRQGDIGTAHVRMNPATNFIWEDGL